MYKSNIKVDEVTCCEGLSPLHYKPFSFPEDGMCFKVLITTTADDILIFMYYSEKIRLDVSCLADESHEMTSYEILLFCLMCVCVCVCVCVCYFRKNKTWHLM